MIKKLLKFIIPAVLVGLFIGRIAYADSSNFWLLSNNFIKPLASTWNLMVGIHSSAPTEADGGIYYNSTTKVFNCGINGSWQNCATATGSSTGITTLNNQTGATQTFATGTIIGLSVGVTSNSNVHTITPLLQAGYVIPLTASTTQWSNLYNTLNTLTLPVPVNLGGTGTSTTPSLNQILLGNASNGYNLVATSSLGFMPYGAYLTTVSVTAPITGNGTAGSPIACSSCLTANQNITLSGAVTGGPSATAIATVFNPAAFATTSSGNGITISTSTTSLTINIPTASASLTGQLSSTDWNTFNNKQASGAYLTSVSGSGSVLSSGGTTPTVQLQNLTANDILFGAGTNTFATSSNFTFNSATNLLTATNITSTNGTSTTFAVTGLTVGNCVQAGTGGLLQSASGACGSAGSGNSAWTIGSGLINNATSTDSVDIGTSTPTTATVFIVGSGSKDMLVVASSTGSYNNFNTPALKVKSDGTIYMGSLATSFTGCVQSSGSGILSNTNTACGTGTVTSVSGSGSILSSGGNTPTIQLQSLTANDVLFGQGSNIIGTSTNFTFTSGTNTLTITGTTTVSNAILIGTTTQSSPFISTTLLGMVASSTSYVETNIINRSPSTTASSDYVLTADNGSSSIYYTDLFQNSSGFTNTGGLSGGAGDSGLFNSDRSLYLGTTSSTNTSANLYLGAQNVVTATGTKVGWTFSNATSTGSFADGGLGVCTNGVTSTTGGVLTCNGSAFLTSAVTSVSGSGSVLSSGGNTPTIQLQALTANDILFGDGTNTFATSSSFTFNSATNLLTATNITSTNGTSTTFAVTGLTVGNCVQAGTGGLLQSASGACGSGGSGNAAWTIGAGKIYNATSTDLVGIGTITPTTTLTIQGKGGTNPFQISSSTGSALLQVNQIGQIVAKSGLGGSNPSYTFDGGDGAGVGIYNDTTGQLSMTVGSGLRNFLLTSTQLEMREGASVSSPLYASQGSTGSGLQIASNIDTLSTNGSGRVTILSTGQVGIATTTPAYQLDVYGTGAINPFNVSSSSNVSLFSIQANGSTTLSSLASGIVQSNSGSLYVVPTNTYQIAGTYVTSVSGSGSILSNGGTTPTIQLQNLTANDVLFGQGTNVIGTSSTFTYTASTNNLFVTNASSTSLTVATNLLDQGTLTVTGQTTIGNASSTALTVSGQTTLATTSVAGINILGTFDKSFSLASTTPDYLGLSFNTATFTIPSIWNPYTTSTLVSLFCKTDAGTLLLNFAGNLLSCTTAGSTSAPNAILNSRADVKVMLGTAATAPNNVSVTGTFHY